MGGASVVAIARGKSLRVAVAILLIALGLVSFAAPAASLGTTYDGLDSTLDGDSSVALGGDDETDSQADDSFGGGAKEDDVCPLTGFGSIPPNKDDLDKFWIGVAGNDLYLAWSRTNTNGTATIEFELNQSSTGCGNGVNKERTIGDVLLTFDFQGGDLDEVPIEVRTWNGSEWSAPDLLQPNEKQASISSDFTFGEMVIDLKAAGIFKYEADGTTPKSCASFAYAFPKSRASSQSFEAQLKDYIGGVTKTVTNCGALKIVKQADPEGTTAFTFGVSGGPTTVNGFNLIDTGSGTANEKTISNLKPGDYTITETLPALGANEGHWDLVSVECSVDETGSGLSRTVAITANSTVTCTFNNTFDPPPTVSVTKTADPTTVNEPGGSVTFSVSVWNTSDESVTVTSLTDTVGTAVTDLLASAANSDCDTVSRELEASDGTRGGTDTMACSFTLNVTGNAGSTHDDTVDATVTDADDDTATDDDDATVTVSDVLPTLQVTKTVQGDDWVYEPGAPKTYDVQVVNTSPEAVTLTSLTDTLLPGGTPTSLFSDSGNCSSLANDALAAYDGSAGGADTATCSFTVDVSGNAGADHRNRVTGTVQDDEGNSASAHDDETVRIVDVAPTVDVTKTASTSTVNEPGGNVTFTVVVENLAPESVTITELTDTVGGTETDLLTLADSNCSELAGDSLAANDGEPGGPDEASCTFTLFVGDNAGDTHENRVDVTVVDDEQNPASDYDEEVVTVLDVAPDVVVTKTAEPESVPEPGDDVTFTVKVENRSVEPVTITDLTDVVTEGDTTDLLGLVGSNCSSQSLSLAAADEVDGSGPDTFTCTFTMFVAGDAGDEHHDTVTVIVADDEGNQADGDDDAHVAVEDVEPTVTLTKAADPTELDEPGGTATYTVTVKNTSIEPVTITSLTDQVQPDGAVIDLLGDRAGNECVALDGHELAADDGEPGGADEATCTFTGDVSGNARFVHRNLVRVTAVDNEGNPANAEDDATVTLRDVAPEIDVDKTASPASVQEPGGNVTFTVVVTNLSDEVVTLESLTDVVGEAEGIDVFDIAGTTCEAGVELAAADAEANDNTYTCQFTVRVAGSGGTSVTDVVTAVAVDDDGSKAEASDDATVTITPRPGCTVNCEPPPPPPPPPPPVEEPGISVAKSASAGVVRSGDTVTYTYVVSNTGENALSNVTLTDDKCSNVEFVNGDDDGDVLLDLDETWTFTCEQALTEDTTNVATVVGTDPDGDTVDDTDDAFVDVINPGIAIDKSANVTTATLGDTIVYTYEVTNTGDDPLADVAVTDDKCAPVTFVGGDDDGDELLDVAETWTFTCTDVADESPSLTNVAVVVGSPTVGPEVENEDTVTLPVTSVLGEVFEKPKPPAVAPGVLARTGSEAIRSYRIGVVMIGLGVLMLLATRRRRPA